MKKYLKLVVVVAGVTIAVFGNSSNAFAKKSADHGHCNSSNDDCGTSYGGQAICGTYIAG